MLLQIFRRNYSYNFFLFPIIALGLLFAGFLKNTSFSAYQVQTIFQYHNSILLHIFTPKGLSYIASMAINFLLLITAGFLLLRINAKFSFVKERTFLPVYLYLFIVLGIANFHVLQPVMAAAVFIIIAIERLFSSFDKNNNISNTFDSAFMTSIAGLFFFYANIFIVLIPVSIFILSGKLSWRTIFITLTGMALPWLILFSLFYVFFDTNQLIIIIKTWFDPQNELLLNSVPLLVYFSFMILITVISSFFIIKQYSIKSISNRKFFKILFFFFLTSLILLITPMASAEILAIMAIPLTFLFTNYFLLIRRRKWAEILFTTLIIVSLILQFFE